MFTSPFVVESINIYQDGSEPMSRKEALLRTVAWERMHPPRDVDPKMFDYEAEDALLAELRENDS